MGFQCVCERVCRVPLLYGVECVEKSWARMGDGDVMGLQKTGLQFIQGRE